MINLIAKLFHKNHQPVDKPSIDNPAAEEKQSNDAIIRIGDSVSVLPGIKNPDNENDISGWQGRVSEAGDDDLITIQWDSHTLKKLTASEIIHCEKEGCDWSEMTLSTEDVSKCKPRDAKTDVENVKNNLEDIYYWSCHGKTGERIQAVLEKADGYDDDDHFKAWLSFLGESLKFPFDAIVTDWDRTKPFANGDRITVTGIAKPAIDQDYDYGIMITADKNGKGGNFPLCCIEIKSKKTEINQKRIVSDYSYWFANKPE